MAKNNVYNFIRVKGDEEKVKRMMAAVTVMTDEGIPCFDFNKVIPMPEELRVTHDGISAIRGHINNYLTMVNPCTPVYDSSFEKLSDKDFAELYKAIFKYYNQERTHLVNSIFPRRTQRKRGSEKSLPIISKNTGSQHGMNGQFRIGEQSGMPTILPPLTRTHLHSAPHGQARIPSLTSSPKCSPRLNLNIAGQTNALAVTSAETHTRTVNSLKVFRRRKAQKKRTNSPRR